MMASADDAHAGTYPCRASTLRQGFAANYLGGPPANGGSRRYSSGAEQSLNGRDLRQ